VTLLNAPVLQAIEGQKPSTAMPLPRFPAQTPSQPSKPPILHLHRHVILVSIAAAAPAAHAAAAAVCVAAHGVDGLQHAVALG